jgi:hypothetical protein
MNPLIDNPGIYQPVTVNVVTLVLFMAMLIAGSLLAYPHGRAISMRRRAAIIFLLLTGSFGTIGTFIESDNDRAAIGTPEAYNAEVEAWLSQYGVTLDAPEDLEQLVAGEEVLVWNGADMFPVQLSEHDGNVVLIVTGSVVAY